MIHKLALYGVDRRVIDEVVTKTWEHAESVLTGWNKRYGDDFVIAYRRYKETDDGQSIPNR